MQHPQTDGKVYGLIKNSGDKIVVVYFGRASSYLCNGLALLLEELASSYAGHINVVFASADLDQCGTAVASIFGVEELPTTVFFRNGALLFYVQGFQIDLIKEVLRE